MPFLVTGLEQAQRYEVFFIVFPCSAVGLIESDPTLNAINELMHLILSDFLHFIKEITLNHCYAVHSLIFLRSFQKSLKNGKLMTLT